MKIIIIFIIITYVIFVSTTEDRNISKSSNEFCSVNYNRRKRNANKYTLWRKDADTTEFIVNVPDDEVTPHKMRSIVGVNIQPITRNMPKIILGAPIIPRHTTGNDEVIDYTRFKAQKSQETEIEAEDLKDVPKILWDKISQISPTGSHTVVATRTPLVSFQVAPVMPSLKAIPKSKLYSSPSKYFPNKNEEDLYDTYNVSLTRTEITQNVYRTTQKFRPTLTSKSVNELWFYANEIEDDEEENNVDNSTMPTTEYYDDDQELTFTTKNIRKYFNDAVKTTINTFPTFADPVHESSNNVCCLTKLRPGIFDSPRTLSEIVAQLRKWAEGSPIAKWVDITYSNLTSMNNPIYMMIVDDPSTGQIASAKQIVMIVAGIQGRDHHAVTSAMYILYQLIERTESNTVLLKSYRFWIIPVFNPDGYDYSITFPKRRQWTKNLRQNWEECNGRKFCSDCKKFGIGCTLQNCYGVHLDRNFEYQWMVSEKKEPCGALFSGSRQLSEPETLALTKYVEGASSKIFTFFTLKEGDVLGVMYPHSHTKKKRVSDYVYRHRATRAAAAAFSINGRSYVAGQTSEYLPLYAGGIEEWVEGHLGVDNTYTIMMHRPIDVFGCKLSIERIVHEAYAAMDTLLLQSLMEPPPPASPLVRSSTRRRSKANINRAKSLQFMIPLAILSCF